MNNSKDQKLPDRELWFAWSLIASLFVMVCAGVIISSFSVLIKVALIVTAGIFSLYLAKWGHKLLGQVGAESDNAKELEKIQLQEYQKLEAILRSSHLFATGRDEETIIDLGLKLVMEMLDLKGASFTPLDERGQTLPPRLQGRLPEGITLDWLEYLSSPEIRKTCPKCQKLERIISECPMLGHSDQEMLIYCLPVRRADQEYGIFHLFFGHEKMDERGQFTTVINQESEALIQLVASQTAMALDGIRLRNKETLAYAQTELSRQKVDAGVFIADLLETILSALPADWGGAYVWRVDKPDFMREYSCGDSSVVAKPILEGVIQSVQRTKETVVIGELTRGNRELTQTGSLVASPVLCTDGRVMGILVAASGKHKAFDDRQLSILNTMASQAAYVLQNESALAEVEHKAILQERIRLAREIHDGLAQTLGFLKLKISQLRGYLQQGEQERARQSVELLYSTVSDAYIEARYAIDQLRVSVDEEGFTKILEEILKEFRETSGIDSEFVEKSGAIQLPVEISSQFIRIVQESLSNIRKHAKANHVQLVCAVSNGNLVVEIHDDGVGFYPEEVHRQSQYGLKGMKERAELINADLQIISRPQEGTIVQIRLPLNQVEERE